MPPPCYVRDEAELKAVLPEAKQWPCPHCRQYGTLNGHGLLRGGAPGVVGKDTVRGRRFYCSARRRRPGCGRTFAVLLAEVIAGASVRAAAWWRFIAARLEGASVLAAWESARSGFSLEAAYRWWRQWRGRESAVRTVLWSGRDPPERLLRETILARYGADDPVAVFQAKTQQPWPTFAS